MVGVIFGYLKPYNNELKLKHINEYKMAYCTVCYGLRKKLGLLSAILLNYESVFLYLFLDGIIDDTESNQIEFRCPTNPMKKVKSNVNNQLLEYVSFTNYLLVLLKVIDNCRDSKKVIYKIIYALMVKNKKYIELQEKYSTVDTKARQLYDELYRLETSENQGLDECLATMGNVLCEIVGNYLESQRIESRKSKDFAKHLGMWVYLVDAYDDYEKDIKKRMFNPLYAFRIYNHNTDINSTKLQTNDLTLIYAEAMLGMMIKNMKELLKEINMTGHIEIVNNVVEYAMGNTVRKIKQKREEKRNIKKHFEFL